MSKLEQAITMMVWSDVQKLPVYDTYRKYERGFKFEDKDYTYKCRYKIEDGFLKVIEAKIEYAQVEINLMH